MRRIVMFNRVTADGYFAGPDGSLDWVVPEQELDRGATERMAGSGTVLFGRRTYEQFEGFWPKVVDEAHAAPDPHSPVRRSPEMLAMARWLDDATKVVFSRTLKEVTWRNSRLLPELEPREIEAMKSEPGEEMMVFGSGSIVSQLTEHGLIDEYRFIVTPVLIGSGQLLLSGVSKRLPLDLLDATDYPSGNVMLRYARSN